VNRETYATNLRRAAADADWQRAERLGRAYGWSLLGRGVLTGVAASIALAARWASRRRRRLAGR
jgi:hypothetical protein